jgi:hypothetical protein
MNATMEDPTTDLAAIDPNDGTYAPFEEASAGSSTSRICPQPGSYKVRLPNSLPDACFSEKSGVLTVTLDNLAKGPEAEGLIIVEDKLGGTHVGYSARYNRITTKMQTVKDFKTGAPAVNAEGNALRFNNVWDMLRLLGETSYPEGKQAWIDAIRKYEGETIPAFIYMKWEGKALGELENGYPRRVKQGEFLVKDSNPKVYANAKLVAVNTFEGWDREAGRKRQFNIGETYEVEPRLVLNFRAFEPQR